MYVPRHAREPVTGTLATPHEINAELAAILAQHNGGLDRENIDGEQIINEKVGNNELQDVAMFTEVTQQTVTIDDGGFPGSTYAVPDSSGDPWIVERSFDEEGQLTVHFGTSITLASGVLGLLIHVYILVDGVTVAQLDAGPSGRGHTVIELEGSVPVPAGSHVVEVRFGFGNLSAYSATYPLVFEERNLLLDWVSR